MYEDQGARIAASVRRWGEKVFSSVFGSGPARDAYLGMRARGDVELVFRPASPSLLGLPWELMADPARDRPLALEVAGVGRSLPVAPDATQTVAVPGGRLRVLMVISRSAGGGDVGYRMIARPLLGRLEAVRGAVDLVVLRPPTLEGLRAELAAAAAAGTPYQVVHFDGHGAMPGRLGGAGSPLLFVGSADEGVLVFEKPGGGADDVAASRVAQVLADAKVPVVVLNACQSAAVGKELEAAVATAPRDWLPREVTKPAGTCPRHDGLRAGLRCRCAMLDLSRYGTDVTCAARRREIQPSQLGRRNA